MKDDIKKWLKSDTPDYNAGVLLFAKHSRNKSLLHFFTRKGSTAMLKLRYELGKIAGEAPPARRSLPVAHHPLPTAPANCRLHIDPDGKINPNDLPEHLRTLYDKNVEDYKLLRGAHAKMDAAKNRNERRKYRKQVEKLDTAIAARWETIDNWVASGNPSAPGIGDPPVPEVPPDSETGLTPQDVNAYRTYISRYIAEPDKLTDDKRATMQERISAMLAGGQKFDDETIAKLTALGFTLE